MLNAPPLSRPIRKEEAASLIGRSLRSLERAMVARQVRYYKIGKTVAFAAEDLAAYRARFLVTARGGEK
jgi:hypothetical protein